MSTHPEQLLQLRLLGLKMMKVELLLAAALACWRLMQLYQERLPQA